VQGATVFLVVAGIYWVASAQALAPVQIRTMAFVSLVLSVISLILVNRSFGPVRFLSRGAPSASLAMVLAAVGLTLTLSLLWPPFRALFAFAPLGWAELMLAAVAGVVVWPLLEQARQFWPGARLSRPA
jgi:Ca2+-transporting ATPase